MQRSAAVAARPSLRVVLPGGTRAPEPSISFTRDWLPGLIVAAAAFLLDLNRLAATSLWGDEAFSVGLAQQPWRVLWHYLWGREANMALYHMLLRGWLDLTALVGLFPSEVVIRLPSVVFAVLSVVVVFLIGRRVGGRVAAVLGSALYLLNYLQLLAAAEARAYSLELFLVCLSWYALLVALEGGNNRNRWWALYAASTVLAAYTQIFSVLAFASQMVALWLWAALPESRHQPWRFSVGRVVSLGAICLLLIPLGIDAGLHGGGNSWLRAAGLRDLLRLLYNLNDRSVVFGLLMAAILAFTLGVWWVRARPLARPRNALGTVDASTVGLLSWLLVPIGLSYGASLPALNLHLFGDRYLVVVVPALSLLVAVAVARLRRRTAQVVLSLCLGVAALPGVFGYYANVQRQDFRSGATWLQQHFQPGDGLVCLSPSCGPAMEYYLRAIPGPAAYRSEDPGMWAWEDDRSSQGWPLKTKVDLRTLEAYARDHARVFLIDSTLGGDPATIKAQAQTAQDWLDSHARLVTQEQSSGYYGPVTIREYDLAGP